jgi:hypothetical protein
MRALATCVSTICDTPLHLARDVVQSANDEIGAAMQAAIKKPRSKVVKLRGQP